MDPGSTQRYKVSLSYTHLMKSKTLDHHTFSGVLSHRQWTGVGQEVSDLLVINLHVQKKKKPEREEELLTGAVIHQSYECQKSRLTSR